MRNSSGGWLLASEKYRIKAQRACAGGGQIKKNKAVNHRQFASIFDGPECARGMNLEIRDRHLSRKNEGNRPGEQSQEDQPAADQFQDAGQSLEGKQLDRAVAGRIIEKFL